MLLIYIIISITTYIVYNINIHELRNYSRASKIRTLSITSQTELPPGAMEELIKTASNIMAL